MLRDVSTTTASMRRARRELAEMREMVKAQGLGLDHETIALYEHLSACSECELREHMDSSYCPMADAILDGPYEDDAKRRRREQEAAPCLS